MTEQPPSPADRPSEAELMKRLGLPQPGEPVGPRICDFCEKPPAEVPAVVAYPVTPPVMNLAGLPVGVEVPFLASAWTACKTCAAFIDAGDYAGLAQHMGYAPGGLPATLIMFREARIGPAQRL